MNRKWFSIAALVAAASLFFSLSSCARNQHLVSIAVQPDAVTFGAVDKSLAANLTAYGTYVHPPQTKDITTRVTWQSDISQVAQVTSAGVVSPNTNCGTAGITATFNDGGNLIVSSTVTITVEGPASQGCPQGGALNTLAVTTSGTGTGVIVSSPAGINCGATCSAQFATGTTVTVTATPTSPSKFGGWAGCDSPPATNPCTVAMTTNRTVTVTFN